MGFSTDRERWQALCLRTPAAHSSFIYGVVTTRIFCRPTCPARLARRANVVFFDTATDATQSGFRACKRCKPATADQPAVEEQRLDVVQRACGIMSSCSGDISPGQVAKEVGLSYRYFHGMFKGVMGMTPAKFAKQCSQRIEMASTSDTTSSVPSNSSYTVSISSVIESDLFGQLDTVDMAGLEQSSGGQDLLAEDLSLFLVDGDMAGPEVPADWLPWTDVLHQDGVEALNLLY